VRREELWSRLRHRLRRLVRRIWPGAPRSWSDIPSTLRPATAQVSRLTGAAVLAYLASAALHSPVIDLTAPLTALLVVQASTVSTLRMGLVRVGAVLTGVLLAIGVSSSFGLAWWSLGAVVAVALVLARVLRLGPQSLEAAISAMLILGVASHSLAAETRVMNTLVGAGVGIVISLLVPVTIPNTRARHAVRGVARAQAALLDRVADALASRVPAPQEADEWLGSLDDIGRELAEAADAVDVVEERRKLNPRALAALRIHPELRVGLQRLDQCRSAERALIVVIKQETTTPRARDDRTRELRRAFSVVVDSLSQALDVFGDLIASDRAESAEEARDRLAELVAETRAILTELTMIDVDAQVDSGTWMLQGSMLVSIDHVLRQLDLEHPEQATSAWNPRPGLEWLPRTVAETGQRLGRPVRGRVSALMRGRRRP
jgi:hypothetical protein